MEDHFNVLVEQIRADLDSVGQLYPGRRLNPQGVAVIIDPSLPRGWIGIRDQFGREAFGQAFEILSAVQCYVDTLGKDGRASFFQSRTFWLILREFPTERPEAKNALPLPRQT